MQCKAAACQCVENAAPAPIQRQETTGLARCGASDAGAFHNDDLDAAAAQEVGRARADDAASADYDPHCSFLIVRMHAIAIIAWCVGPAAPAVTAKILTTAHFLSYTRPPSAPAIFLVELVSRGPPSTIVTAHRQSQVKCYAP